MTTYDKPLWFHIKPLISSRNFLDWDFPRSSLRDKFFLSLFAVAGAYWASGHMTVWRHRTIRTDQTIPFRFLFIY